MLGDVVRTAGERDGSLDVQSVLYILEGLERCSDSRVCANGGAPTRFRRIVTLRPNIAALVPYKSAIQKGSNQDVLNCRAILHNLRRRECKHGLIVVEVQDVALFLMPRVVEALGFVLLDLRVLC
ncbi:hypothetical protein D3C71_1621000 [compost metagenome]